MLSHTLLKSAYIVLKKGFFLSLTAGFIAAWAFASASANFPIVGELKGNDSIISPAD
jgi:hypothetical protein